MEVTSDEKTFAIIANISPLLFGFIGPLVIFLIKKDQSKFVRENARHALNFQISVLIYAIISLFLMLFIIGFFLIIILAISNFILIIIGAIKASNGEIYSYPLELNIVN